MLWVYLDDGRTLHFDLFKEKDLTEWNEQKSDELFQRSITGVALYKDGTLQTLSRPANFRKVHFDAEVYERRGHPVERIVLEADDFIVTKTAYRNGATPEVTATKIRRGRFVYKPKGV